MANASDILEAGFVAHICGGSAYAQPTLYVGLATGSTGLEAGTATDEMTETSYARVAVTWTGSGSSRSNSNVISFTPTADMSTDVTHWFLADAASAGNVIAWGAVNTPRTLASGDTWRYAAGAFIVTVD